MNYEDVRTYCMAKAAVTEETPFDEITVTYKVAGKIFLFMPLDQVDPGLISIKCQPERNIELRAEYPSIQGAYHLNKKHWSQIILDGTVPDDRIFELIDNSYALVVKKLPKKVRDELQKD